MAISNKFSFTVRSILDLPENDTESIAHHSPVDSFSVSPYSSWTENDREHICKFLNFFFFFIMYFFFYMLQLVTVKHINAHVGFSFLDI